MITSEWLSEEIAGVAAFAVSPAARWMTDIVLRLHGGGLRSV
jgi:hypothetical protein